MSKPVYTAIGDILNLRRGHDLTKEEMNDDGKIPVVGSNGIIGYHNQSTTQKPCLTVGRSGSVGSVHFNNEICWAHNTTLYVDNFKSNNPKYVYYLLKNLDLAYLHSGSVVPSLNRNYLHPIKVPFYEEKKDQDYIENILSNLDQKIELNNKINTQLEAMAKTLYDYWFVQFDFPNEEGKPYKSSGGEMVYSEELKREIPLGWEVGTLEDISDIVRGVSYNKNDICTPTTPNTTPILRATNITGNAIDLDNMVFVPNEFVSEKQLMKKFEILLTMSSGSKEHIGKNGLFLYDEKVGFGAFCAKLVAKKDYTFFLYSFTQSENFFATIKNVCLGTNINNLNGTLVKGFKTIIPNKKALEQFNNIVSPMYEKIGVNYQENQQLATLRDWLLPMLMNGQVSVGGEN